MIFDYEKHLKSLYEKATNEEKVVLAILEDKMNDELYDKEREDFYKACAIGRGEK